MNVMAAHYDIRKGFRCKCVYLHILFLRLATTRFISRNFAARRQLVEEINIFGIMGFSIY